jgi:hypothetical protein
LNGAGFGEVYIVERPDIFEVAALGFKTGPHRVASLRSQYLNEAARMTTIAFKVLDERLRRRFRRMHRQELRGSTFARASTRHCVWRPAQRR